MSTSVILPTYNERENVCPVIEQLKHVLKTPEIVVIDDNSPDGTAEIVQDKYPNVTVHVRENQSGLGSAVKDGFELANGRYYLCMDADGQHRPSDCPQIVSSLEDGADVAIGSRFTDGATHNAGWFPHRYLISAAGSTLAYAALPLARGLTDPMSGFFGVDSAVIDPVIDDLEPEGYKILLEVLARCPVSKISEVPIHFDQRENGSSNLTITEQLRYIKHMARVGYTARFADTTSRESIPEVSDD